MIQMIKKIKDIGAFNNYESRMTGTPKDFSHINLIYGLNTYGKSTICDIMKDMSDDVDSRIKQRISIPDGKSSQVVINTNKGVCSFDEGKWKQNVLKHNIMTFDDEFVTENVFSGTDLIGDRETKEHFTDFILGDEGVKIAKEIEELKKNQKELKSDMEKTIPPSQLGKTEEIIKKYVDMQVDESLNLLTQKRVKLEKDKETVKRQISNIEQIKNYPNIQCNPELKLTKLLDNLQKLSVIWQRSFKIPSEVAVKYQQLLSEHFANDDNAEQWLSQGLQYLDDSNICPFCGQTIESLESLEIINTLKEVFDTAYQTYKDTLMLDLKNIQMEWSVLELSNNILVAKNELNNARKIFGDELSNFDDLLDALYDSAKSEEATLVKKIADMKKLQEANNVIKKTLPGNPVEFEMDANLIFKDYYILIKRFHGCVKDINDKFCDIRENTKKEKATKRAELISQDIDDISNKILRLTENEQCVTWNKLYDRKKDIGFTIDKKEHELEENQELYLTHYFNSIDAIFKRYGSRNFEIKKGKLDRRGKRNIIGIQVLFNGVSINDKAMPRKIFSESDKRALAMAVFMAKIENMPDEEKRNIIIVLDDPITSFDENRMRVATKHILELSDKMHQVLIFTHHFMFACYMKRWKETVNFYQINKISKTNSNGIYDMKSNEYLIDGLEKMYSDIAKFNSGQSNNLKGNDLRKFIEMYLQCVFSKQYADNAMKDWKLGEKVDALFDLGVISATVKEKLHRYQREFNADSHEDSFENVEDLRNSSIEMIEYIFNSIKML